MDTVDYVFWHVACRSWLLNTHVLLYPGWNQDHRLQQWGGQVLLFGGTRQGERCATIQWQLLRMLGGMAGGRGFFPPASIFKFALRNNINCSGRSCIHTHTHIKKTLAFLSFFRTDAALFNTMCLHFYRFGFINSCKITPKIILAFYYQVVAI